MKTILLIAKGLQDWLISKSETNDELVRKHLLVQDLWELPEKLQKSKNNLERNKIRVRLINNALRDLIKNMREQEKEIQTSNEIVDIVEKIFEFDWSKSNNTK